MVRIIAPVILLSSIILVAVAVAAAGWWALGAVLGTVGLWFGVTYDPDES